MNKPQVSAVGGPEPVIVRMLGKDNAGKVAAIARVQNFLFSLGQSTKLVYLPHYDGAETTDTERSFAHGLMQHYAAAGHHVITNVRSDKLQGTAEVAFKTNRVDLKKIQPHLQAPAPEPDTLEVAKVSILSCLQNGVAYSHVNDTTSGPVIPGLEDETQALLDSFVQGQLSIHKELSDALRSAKKPALAANGVLPIGLLVAPSREIPKQRPVPKMEEYLQELPVNASNESYLMLESLRPLNELDITKDILYEISDLPAGHIAIEAEQLSYDSKAALVEDYICKTKFSGKALSGINYRYDACLSAQELGDILADLVATEISLQQVSPLLGYDVPPSIDQLGLGDLYESAFDNSVAMHSQLHANSGLQIAQNACLLGHRVRARLSLSYPELKAAKTSPSTDELKRLAKLKHPLVTSLF